MTMEIRKKYFLKREVEEITGLSGCTIDLYRRVAKEVGPTKIRFGINGRAFYTRSNVAAIHVLDSLMKEHQNLAVVKKICKTQNPFR